MNGSGDGSDGDGWSGRSRGRGNWPPAKQDELRRPHQHPYEITEQANAAQRTEIVRNSTLSPEAQEFVPRSFVPNQAANVHSHSVQNRITAARQSGLNSHSNNVYQLQMMHQNYYQDEQFHRFDQTASYNFSEACSNDHNSFNERKNNELPADLNVTISQIESSIRVLTMSPGEFDRLVSHLVDIINPFLENPSQLKEIVSVIIKQSIIEGNFRYNGARLCTYLETVANPTESATSTFKDILFQQCQEEKETLSNVWQRNASEEDKKKCHGLILFLAELVTQMQSSALILGKLLIQLISTVLHNPAPNSAKNICQALKLSGQTLERSDTNARKDMETVMRQLTVLVTSGNVDSQVRRMVDSVSELRSNSWGRAPTTTTSYRPPVVTQSVPTQAQEALDEPVFYGPDGKVISAEESAFLHGFASENKEEFNDEYNDVDYLVDPEEDAEDDVIAAAYEEFLKLNENNSNQIKN